jgi:hypothetical protein
MPLRYRIGATLTDHRRSLPSAPGNVALAAGLPLSTWFTRSFFGATTSAGGRKLLV